MELAEERRTPGRSSLVTGGEDALDAGLGIIEIATDGADLHIAALLGDHLRLLHGGYAPVGVEDDDLGAGHIPKALQRRLRCHRRWR